MFIDDVLMSEGITKDWPGGEITREMLLKAFRSVFVVKNQNVWEYFQAHMLRDKILCADYPNVAPTMPGMWFEWVAGTKLILDPASGESRSGRLRIGVLCSAEDLTVLGPEEAGPILDSYRECGIEPGPETRWSVMGMVFSQILEPGKKPHILGVIGWRVGHNGELLPSGENNGFAYTLHPRYDTERKNDFSGTIGVGARACWLALSLMHCKNVPIVKSQPIPEALQRARARRCKPPLFRHHTLVIDSSRPVTRDQAAVNMGSSGAALHICRGHFKNFGERGLFGKYTGTYWWPMHARGSAAHGTVTKDYEVRT